MDNCGGIAYNINLNKNHTNYKPLKMHLYISFWAYFRCCIRDEVWPARSRGECFHYYNSQ